jgi:hypothetical protein
LRALRVANVVVANVTEHCWHIRKKQEYKAAASIQASFRGKEARRFMNNKKKALRARELLAEKKHQLLMLEQKLVPVRAELEDKEFNLSAKLDKWSAQLAQVREESRQELAPFRDTLKLEQTRVLSLHSEMESLRTLKSVAAPEPSEEKPSMSLEKSIRQSQFPPIRVPAGTADLSKTSMEKERWASPVKQRSRMRETGKKKLKYLANIYAPACVDSLDSEYGMPPDQARPQVQYRTLQPSLLPRLDKSQHSKSMTSLQHSTTKRKLRDVDGHPVKSERWVLQAALA